MGAEFRCVKFRQLVALTADDALLKDEVCHFAHLFHHLRYEIVYFCLGALFRYGQEPVILQLGVVLAEVVTSEDVVPEELAV